MQGEKGPRHADFNNWRRFEGRGHRGFANGTVGAFATIGSPPWLPPSTTGQFASPGLV